MPARADVLFGTIALRANLLSRVKIMITETAVLSAFIGLLGWLIITF